MPGEDVPRIRVFPSPYGGWMLDHGEHADWYLSCPTREALLALRARIDEALGEEQRSG